MLPLTSRAIVAGLRPIARATARNPKSFLANHAVKQTTRGIWGSKLLDKLSLQRRTSDSQSKASQEPIQNQDGDAHSSPGTDSYPTPGPHKASTPLRRTVLEQACLEVFGPKWENYLDSAQRNMVEKAQKRRAAGFLPNAKDEQQFRKQVEHKKMRLLRSQIKIDEEKAKHNERLEEMKRAKQMTKQRKQEAMLSSLQNEDKLREEREAKAAANRAKKEMYRAKAQRKAEARAREETENKSPDHGQAKGC